jgi:RNA polymerase sigma-70 factor, ECF subfamily
MNRNDAQLIDDYIKGDENALSVLVHRHTSSVYNFVCRMIGNPHDAEDVVQDVFFKIWKNIKKYRKEVGFKTWLFTIARNTAIDRLRKKKEYVFSDMEQNGDGDDVDNFIETQEDSSPLPDEIVMQMEDAHALDVAINSLSVGYKEVLLLRYIEQLTFDEIGKVLKKPLSTVKSQHRRALLTLRNMFNAPK